MNITLKDRKEIAFGTLLVEFELDEGIMNFIPGQYVSITIPQIINPDQRGNQRFFSLTTLPGASTFSIVTRQSNSSFKRALNDLPSGTAVSLNMVTGNFTLPAGDVRRPLIFIAGGIGITPFISMLRYISAKNLNYDVMLLYSNRNKASAAFLDELQDMDVSRENFDLIATMTDDPVWEGPKGFIDVSFIREHVSDFHDTLFYVAGSPRMVDDMLLNLHKLNVSDTNIKYEQLSGYSAVSNGVA